MVIFVTRATELASRPQNEHVSMIIVTIATILITIIDTCFYMIHHNNCDFFGAVYGTYAFRTCHASSSSRQRLAYQTHVRVCVYKNVYILDVPQTCKIGRICDDLFYECSLCHTSVG